MNENERLRKRLVLKEIIEWLAISISCLKNMRTLWTININKDTFECNTAPANEYKNKQYKSLTRSTKQKARYKRILAYSASKYVQAWYKSVIWELLDNCAISRNDLLSLKQSSLKLI